MISEIAIRQKRPTEVSSVWGFSNFHCSMRAIFIFCFLISAGPLIFLPITTKKQKLQTKTHNSAKLLKFSYPFFLKLHLKKSERKRRMIEKKEEREKGDQGNSISLFQISVIDKRRTVVFKFSFDYYESFNFAMESFISYINDIFMRWCSQKSF